MKLRSSMLVFGVLLACDADVPDDVPAAEAPGEVVEELPVRDDGEALRACVVAAPADVEAVAASASGVVLAVPAEDGLLLRRMFGRGCALIAGDVAPIAAGELLDLDDLGNLYVFPAEAVTAGAVSTMLPGEYPGSMVARVDREGRVSKLLSAGRGIWSFGVTPGGDALWVTACGPNGIFEIEGDVVTASMTPPETLWEQHPAALTDAETFWSMGYRTCEPGAALSPDCGYALVRSTPAGSVDVDTTIVDLGGGYEQAELVRCGPHVCGRVAAGVVVWNDAGERLRTLTRGELLASPGEQVVRVTGDARGIYALLRGESGGRVVFVPL